MSKRKIYDGSMLIETESDSLDHSSSSNFRHLDIVGSSRFTTFHQQSLSTSENHSNNIDDDNNVEYGQTLGEKQHFYVEKVGRIDSAKQRRIEHLHKMRDLKSKRKFIDAFAVSQTTMSTSDCSTSDCTSNAFERVAKRSNYIQHDESKQNPQSVSELCNSLTSNSIDASNSGIFQVPPNSPKKSESDSNCNEPTTTLQGSSSSNNKHIHCCTVNEFISKQEKKSSYSHDELVAILERHRLTLLNDYSKDIDEEREKSLKLAQRCSELEEIHNELLQFYYNSVSTKYNGDFEWKYDYYT